MVFKDKFPVQIEFEIDRDKLARYYRLQAILACVVIGIPFGLIISFGFLNPFLLMNPQFTVIQIIGSSLGFLVGGIVAGLLLAVALYYPYFHRSSLRAAQNLRLIVEGPYLRLVAGSYFVVDRRYHFKDIHTYTTCQGPLLKRLGMKALMFNVSLRQVPPVHVDGLIDVDSVRDKLCEIDSARESA